MSESLGFEMVAIPACASRMALHAISLAASLSRIAPYT